MAALAIGFGFVTVQGLRYVGVIGEVKWSRVNEVLVDTLDADRDGAITQHVRVPCAVSCCGACVVVSVRVSLSDCLPVCACMRVHVCVRVCLFVCLLWQDLKYHFDKLMAVLGFGLPSGVAFAAAFLLGLSH